MEGRQPGSLSQTQMDLAAAFLFPKDIDRLLISTTLLLQKNGLEAKEGIAEQCRQHRDIDSIVKVIQAVTAVSSHNAARAEWFDALVTPFTTHLDELGQNFGRKVTGEYALGFILGAFETANWLYEQPYNHCLTEELEFVKRFKRLFQLFLVKGPLSEVVDDWLKHPLHTDRKRYEGRLSGSIKAFARPQVNVGIRYATVFGLLADVSDMINQGKIKEADFSCIGSLIFDQLAYAFFGSMSLGGRITAITLLQRNLLEWKKMEP